MMSEEYYRNKIAKYQAKLGDIQVDVVDDVNPKDVMEGGGKWPSIPTPSIPRTAANALTFGLYDWGKTFTNLTNEDKKAIKGFVEGENTVVDIYGIRVRMKTSNLSPIEQNRYATEILEYYDNNDNKFGRGKYNGKFSKEAGYKLQLIESKSYTCKDTTSGDTSKGTFKLEVCNPKTKVFKGDVYEVIPVELYIEELEYRLQGSSLTRVNVGKADNWDAWFADDFVNALKVAEGGSEITDMTQKKEFAILTRLAQYGGEAGGLARAEKGAGRVTSVDAVQDTGFLTNFPKVQETFTYYTNNTPTKVVAAD